jgi:hypothetical protein
MLKIYRYLYYRLYLWNRKTWGRDNFPAQGALYTVSIVMAMNIGFILLILSVFGIDFFKCKNLNLYVIISAVLLVIIN